MTNLYIVLLMLSLFGLSAFILYRNYKKSEDLWLLFPALLIGLFCFMICIYTFSKDDAECPEYEPVELHLYKLKE